MLVKSVNIIFLIFLLGILRTYAQVDISIMDEQQQAIIGVLVYNQTKEKVYVSNNQGQVHDMLFSENDTITFQHATYQQLRLPFAALRNQNYRVILVFKDIDLGEIVVSASKWEQNKKEVPVKIASIDKEMIRFQNPQTAADLLSASGEVFIQKSQLGGGSPMLRGFATSSVLLVVDGVRMNNAIFREGNVQNVIVLDPNLIEKSEVVFGPGSVIYGSDALGGVMDFHTFKPQLSATSQVVLKGNAMLRYASANQEKTGHIDFNLGAEKWAFLSSFSFSDFDDLRMGNRNHAEYQRIEYVSREGQQDVVLENREPNIQRFSAYSQLNFTQKIRFQPNERLNFDYAFHYSQSSDVPRYDRLIERRNGNLRFVQWNYGPQKWLMNVFEVKYIEKKFLFNQFKLNLAHQYFEESRHDRRFGENRLRSRTEQLDAFSLNLDFDKDLGEKSSLFYGWQGVYNRVNSQGIARDIQLQEFSPIASRYPDGTDYYSLATYLNFKRNWKNFTLNAGVRYSWVGLSGDFESNEAFYDFPFEEINLKNGAFNGSIGGVYRPQESWQMSLNVASGFRAPNVDDVGKVFDSSPGNVVLPNENLQPEYAHTLDFNLQKEWKDWAKLQFNAFHTWVENQMMRQNYSFNGQDSIMYDGVLSRTQALVNAGQSKIYGLSTSLEFNFSRMLQLRTQLTWTQGESKSGEALRHVAPLFGRTELILKKQQWKVNFYSLYNAEVSFENLAPSEREKPHIYATDANGAPYSPAWLSFNLKGEYQLYQNFTLNLGLENIANVRYRPYASGIVAPGRNLIVGLRAKW